MGQHTPVLLREAIDLLDVRDGGTYVDLTLGRAGHSSEILRRIPHGRLIAFDQDGEAVEESAKILGEIAPNFRIIRDNYRNFGKDLDEIGVSKVDGILMDLGVSSPQLDEGERGFSYKEDAPLDMRMDQRQSLTAYDVVNTYSEERLGAIIREYGEDRFARSIARRIVEAREKFPIQTTLQLAEIIKSAKPMAELRKKGHPAKQAFQAIRMEVNHETESLRLALEEAPNRLLPSGRLVIIDFMSLDDGMVKEKFRQLTRVEGSREGFELPDEIEQPKFVSLTKKPIVPSEAELEMNHRAASAKMRGIMRKADT